jgi:hypothetical protein
MNRRLNLDACLENTLKNNPSSVAKATSGRVAKSLGVPERDVALWRAGVTVPKSTDCERLSELLHVDIAWLCADEA